MQATVCLYILTVLLKRAVELTFSMSRCLHKEDYVPIMVWAYSTLERERKACVNEVQM